MALSQQFHQHVCNNKKFTRNVIELVVDEAHCISEWGTEDFRQQYRDISGDRICRPPKQVEGMLLEPSGAVCAQDDSQNRSRRERVSCKPSWRLYSRERRDFKETPE
jgi:hypothetical protein